MNQLSMFDGEISFKITKPIRLITLFSGYDSQKLAFNYLGILVEHWKTCEWAVKSIQALKDLNFDNDKTDYSKEFTYKQIKQFLFEKGISNDYNSPMNEKQIARLGEQKARTIYNNIIATHNLVNIKQVKANDLNIVDTDKYDYIMTYSFPCQDLSKAGLGKGMEKGNNTRSGMLWEVERILDECNGNLPQILLMENVPDVIGTKNIKHFAYWLKKLENLGYHCYWEILNAKDYGIPQNRKRCFMISILGDYNYQFPQPFKLEKRLKDLLEDNVDEKYFLSEKMQIANNEFHDCCPTLDTRCDCLGIVVKDLTTKNKRLANMVENNKIDINKVQAIDIYNQLVHDEMHTIKTNIDKANMTAITQNLRIRKLTPMECFRLMGVKDQDFYKIAQNQSNASLYHLAGDSIVVNVLMAIFKNLFKKERYEL